MTEPELIEAMAVAIWNLEHGDGYNEWKRAPVDERDDYCELARAALEAIKSKGCKVMAEYPAGDAQCRNTAGEVTLKGNTQRHGAAKLHDYVRAGVSGLDEATEIWREMWKRAPWWPGEGR